MLPRQIKLNKNNSIFLIGPRGTGKSTLAKQFLEDKKSFKINLLLDSDEERFGQNPDEVLKVIQAQKPDWVLIDEVQKAPKLLDIAHVAIEEYKTKFFLTGSSARKLKRESANLLAGRAFTYNLHPFSYFEIENNFDLDSALRFGSLPKLHELHDQEEKELFLRTYTKSYLTEEIIMEQVVRNVDLFRDFLNVAAQCNGKILNYSKIARELGSTDKTIKEYFQILEDTLIAFKLPAFHRSIRKSQKLSPKFYLFDTGIKRSIEKLSKIPLAPATASYREAFEHFIILEIMKLNDYKQLDFKLSYLNTSDAEIDLIISRPGQKELLIEIKSSTKIREDDTRTLQHFAKNWDRDVEAEVWSQDPVIKKEAFVLCQPWQLGLKKLSGQDS